MFTVSELRYFIHACARVYSEDLEEIGTVRGLYIDEPTGAAGWALVTLGHFDHPGSLVPLDDARLKNDLLLVPYGKRLVKEAPRLDPGPWLRPEEEDLLYRFYAVDDAAYDGSESTAQPDPASARNETGVPERIRAGNRAKKFLTVRPPSPRHPGEIRADPGLSNEEI